MCPSDTDFLSSDDFYANLLHIFTAIGLPLQLFGAFIIVTRTPEKMRSAKSSMLQLHCVGAFFDLFFSFISIPVITIPGSSGYFLGIGAVFGISSMILSFLTFVFIGILAANILLFFEDRHHRLVYRSNGEKNWKRVLYIFSQYLITSVYALPGYLRIPDQEHGRALLKEHVPCITDKILQHPGFFVLSIDDKAIIYSILFILVLILTQAFFFVFRIFWYLFHITSVSKNTAHLQKQFFFAICFHVIIPLIVLSIPSFYIFFAMRFDYYNQAATNIALSTISCHGILSTITMLIFHTPYRSAIIGIVSFKSESSSPKIWSVPRVTVPRS
ncbi:Serpentine Receptor, class H [Caenorhabditis elegans]|uniref:Serpentine Receptor, class H n=1 Tax=Caenorhabditis elegans TaxID=6239 RepID=Q9U3C5_CAEEL|nr:Serpentine Receptor, class H [Caenorhabditis elegans]CAB04548.2 Serpentine Receptor, class H [Caenorhabditis elegans]|eukprot:NP_507925.1 Serpentine Receptor, class H [Caenorhabditis elegans]